MASISTGVLLPGATAAAGARTIDVDVVDKAAALLPGLLSYMRPKRVANPNAAFQDRMALAVAPLNTGIVRTAADASFGGRASFDYSAIAGNPHQIDVVAPTSLTFLFVGRVAAWKAAASIYSDTAGFAVYTTTAGALCIDPDWNTGPNPESGSLAAPFALNETFVGWVSHDAVTKISRWGKNTAVPLGSFTHTQAHAPTASHRPRPFGFFNAAPGNQFGGQGGLWALSSVAMGTGIGNADVPLANLVTAIKSHYGIA